MTLQLPPPLIALTPGDLDSARPVRLLMGAARAITAGLRGVLLREPALADGALLELARSLAQLLEPVGGWLGIHDRAHLAAGEPRARAVHLGFRSLLPADVRRVVGEQIAIGRSTHAGDGPEAWQACDYRFFGPVLETPSKRGLVEPAGFEGLAAACGDGLPVWAIGGLLPEHAGRVLEAGAAGLVARAGLLGAADPAEATAHYLEALA